MRFLLPILALAYIVCPYDLLPDFILGAGWIDDLIVLGLLWWWFFVYRKKRYRYETGNPRKDQSSGQEGERNSKEEEIDRTPKDPYSVLGIRQDASQVEIKNAYRELANRYHPDKVNYLGDEFTRLAERRFKEIQEAYRELLTK